MFSGRIRRLRSSEPDGIDQTNPGQAQVDFIGRVRQRASCLLAHLRVVALFLRIMLMQPNQKPDWRHAH